MIESSVKWFRSFLTNRKQQTQIGSSKSEAETISIGCPQGSLLSPLLFLIYVADMELWVENVTVTGYADDTASYVSDKDEDAVIKKLEGDAERILRFMASNYLSANAQKTGFMLIRGGRLSTERVIAVGDELIEEEANHRVLGIMVNNNLTWNEHVFAKGGLLSSVNQRVGALRRLSYHVPRKFLPEIATALIASKIRYGIEIYGGIRVKEEDPLSASSKDLQIALNEGMRVAVGVRKRDRVRIADLTKQTGIQSVNRMAAEASLSLIWRSINVESSPLTAVIPRVVNMTGRSSRSETRGDLQSVAVTSLGRRNFPEPAVGLWNSAASTVKAAASKRSAKTAIKNFVNNLPL